MTHVASFTLPAPSGDTTVCLCVCRIEERKVLIVGLLIGACGFFVILPMSDKPPELITIASM